MKILTTSSHKSAHETPNAPATVWVLDPNGESGDGIAWLLRISGYRAIVLSDRATDAAPHRHTPPALVVGVHCQAADDGRDFLPYCRTLSADAPVLIVSDQPPDVPPELARDAITVLTHPLDAGKFCSTVHRTIARASLRGLDIAQRPPPAA